VRNGGDDVLVPRVAGGLEDLRVAFDGPARDRILDRILAEEVVARFEGRDINRDIPEYAPGRTLPTGEALCLDIWKRVAARLPAGCRLTSVRVEEDPTLHAEYRGEV
jgi:6-pyruvoyl-tetrahydropterin synthase